MEQSKTRTIRTAMCLIQKPTIGKTACLLLMLTALTLFIGCSATQTPDEPKWNDMYEVRSYQIETVTNEIVTTVFMARYVETNKVFRISEPITDFGGYNFDSVGRDRIPTADELEFQCVGESCETKGE